MLDVKEKNEFLYSLLHMNMIGNTHVCRAKQNTISIINSVILVIGTRVEVDAKVNKRI